MRDQTTRQRLREALELLDKLLTERGHGTTGMYPPKGYSLVLAKAWTAIDALSEASDTVASAPQPNNDGPCRYCCVCGDNDHTSTLATPGERCVCQTCLNRLFPPLHESKGHAHEPTDAQPKARTPEPR